LTRFKQRIDELTLVPAGGGCFEVTVDGEPVYSKLQTGQFPDEGAIMDVVTERLRKPVG
jgi:selenoprotein W-related protein